MIHLDVLEKFLELARCPACKEKLAKMESGIVCQACSKVYQYNSDGILLFAPENKLENPNYAYGNQRFVERYAGVYAFGYIAL